jgi:hypothetical protein
VTGLGRRRLRRLLRRAARHPRLEPAVWRIRAWRRGRAVPPPRAKPGDRRARVAVPPRIRAVEGQLELLAADGGPIVAGPWRGSLGAELLYWIPFLRWFGRRFGVDRSRIAAVSRPGAAPWYANACGSQEAPAGARQLPVELLEAVCGDYWQERGPLVHVLDRLAYARVPTPDLAVPKEAVVQWPAEEEDVAWPDELGRPVPVPVPGCGDRVDAAAVTAAITGAGLLVGPWDPRLLLGPMLGTPTVALTTTSSASPHLDLARRAALALETPLVFVDRGQIDLIVALARRIGPRSSGSGFDGTPR